MMEHYARKLQLEDALILDVGIGGDPKPSSNYRFFGAGNTWETMDCDPMYEPTHVGDIRETELEAETYDMIIISHTIEHMTSPWKAPHEAYRLLKKGGHLIIDSPWNYPYHPDDNFDDYQRFTHKGLEAMCREAGFEIVESKLLTQYATCLAHKK